MADPSSVRVVGPLAVFAGGFAGELLRQGYTPDSACLQMRLMAHMSRWLVEEHLQCAALGTDEVLSNVVDEARPSGATEPRKRAHPGGVPGLITQRP